jgi:hypothetical protein
LDAAVAETTQVNTANLAIEIEEARLISAAAPQPEEKFGAMLSLGPEGMAAEDSMRLVSPEFAMPSAMERCDQTGNLAGLIAARARRENLRCACDALAGFRQQAPHPTPDVDAFDEPTLKRLLGSDRRQIQ